MHRGKGARLADGQDNSASIVESVFYYPQGSATISQGFEHAARELISRRGSSSSYSGANCNALLSSSAAASKVSPSSSSTSTLSSSNLKPGNLDDEGRMIDRGFGSALPTSASFTAVYPSLRDLLAQPVGREGMPSAYPGEAPDAVAARSAALRACISTIDQIIFL